ncbi:hypothetical protein DFJ73DRAFT_782787 [Zopfochytrium polystomum]|nr:hypothetical protein DFJ73DRAFT_782787 [Zopfochytrium polystomum]
MGLAEQPADTLSWAATMSALTGVDDGAAPEDAGGELDDLAAAEKFGVAVNIFIHLFVTTPLFSPSVTERELLAVDLEQKKNLQSDGWRIHQLKKDLSKKTLPYRNFVTGNDETLKGAEGSCGGRNVCNEVVSWHLLSVGALRTEIRIKPVKENRELQINFAFPDLIELYLCKPSSVLVAALGAAPDT